MSAVHSTTRQCTVCEIGKPTSEFSREPRTRIGLQSQCKRCRSEAKKSVVPPPDYVPPESKACTGCGVVKPLAEFAPYRYNRDGRQSRCRDCGRAYMKSRRVHPETRSEVIDGERRRKIKYRYGITESEYDHLDSEQGGVCAICGQPPSGTSRNGRLHVDHDHETGKVRGLLCHRCNNALGTFGDNIAGLMKAVDYLRRSTESS